MRNYCFSTYKKPGASSGSPAPCHCCPGNDPIVFQLMTHVPVLPAGLGTSGPATVSFISAPLIPRHRTQHNVAAGQTRVRWTKERCQGHTGCSCLCFNQTLKDLPRHQIIVCPRQNLHVHPWPTDQEYRDLNLHRFQREEEGGWRGRVVIAAT